MSNSEFCLSRVLSCSRSKQRVMTREEPAQIWSRFGCAVGIWVGRVSWKTSFRCSYIAIFSRFCVTVTQLCVCFLDAFRSEFPVWGLSSDRHRCCFSGQVPLLFSSRSSSSFLLWFPYPPELWKEGPQCFHQINTMHEGAIIVMPQVVLFSQLFNSFILFLHL